MPLNGRREAARSTQRNTRFRQEAEFSSTHSSVSIVSFFCADRAASLLPSVLNLLLLVALADRLDLPVLLLCRERAEQQFLRLGAREVDVERGTSHPLGVGVL